MALIRRGIRKLAYSGFFNWMPDEMYLKLLFYASLGYTLNLKNPQTFNEKLQWLKLNDRNPRYTMMVDKYKVKDYVASVIGKEHIIPTLGVWDCFEMIDFSLLPERFVLKCTHDSGGLVICKDKKNLDIAQAKKKIEKSIKTKYYYTGREWAYKDVKPRIIAEQFMGEESPSLCSDLTDYKFYCFNGQPRYCQVITDRSSDERIDFFDMEWRHQEFTGLGLPHKPQSDKTLRKPVCFNEMINAAEKLSRDIPFVRIDFYEVNGWMYFGEITFFPASGFGNFRPEKWDFIFGEAICINKFGFRSER